MDMRVNIAGVEWKNPVTVASGTFGSGEEFSEFVDLNRLGAVTTKGVANVPWPGNPTPRVAETTGGMLNAIGLQNPGIDVFVKRDIPFLIAGDAIMPGVLIAQACGRWGNFFNREAFGSYTNSLFAMQIPTNFFIEHGRIDEIVSNGLYDKATYVVSGNEAATFIQVHPTFLYESMWNLVLLLLIIFFFTKRKKFDGELIAIYCIGYGIGRFLIEGLRTDSLMIGSTGIRVSQILALILAVFGTAFIIYKRKKITK